MLLTAIGEQPSVIPKVQNKEKIKTSHCVQQVWCIWTNVISSVSQVEKNNENIVSNIFVT